MRQGAMWAALVLLGSACYGLDEDKDKQPEQIHIAYGETIDEMVITWNTQSKASSMVEYGKNGLLSTEKGKATEFVDGGTLQLSQWVHRVHLTGLEPDTKYFYRVGSDDRWSEMFSFETMKEGTDWQVNVAVYGDMGVVNAQALSRLQQEAEKGKYHAMLHLGDFAYDMDTDNGRLGDKFMRMIQPIAAYVPYMTCVGNRESAYNFSNYKARFSMPRYDDTESLFFSFNMGPVHFIAVNTEAYYFKDFTGLPLSRQYRWLVKDLEEATKPEVRAERPWIILFGHRPMYTHHSHSYRIRTGMPRGETFAMEPLLDKYGVDLVFWAHKHVYERFWPIYNCEIFNGSYAEPYTNPRAPVHITTSAAGLLESRSDLGENHSKRSAFRSHDYGYARLSVLNKTHLYFEQVSDDQDGKVIDEVMLIRETHEPYPDIRARHARL